MLSRRSLLQRASAVAVVAMVPKLPALAQAGALAGTSNDGLRWTDPHIGTGGHGHTYPGAAMPFGAVQLSPDTYNDDWDWCSGYHDTDGSIMGFSHTHLSGTGCGDLLDFLVMAGTGPAKLVSGTREDPESGYRSRYSHADEQMEPGYYSVLLKDYKVRAELTATDRTGLHRYTFPQSDQAYLIVDLQHSYLTNKQSSVESAEVQPMGGAGLTGGHVTAAWGNHRHSYFAMEFSKKPEKIVFFSDDHEVPAPAHGQQLEGKNLKAVAYFKTHADELILVRTGISGVSADGAAKNLKAECNTWNFDKVRSNAKAAWAKQLGKIQVTTDNEAHKKVFYTALYHMSLGPTLFDDVDGQYRGMDNQVHTLPAGAGRNYTSFSLWDTFRAAHPAYTLVESERVPEFVNTLIRMAEQSPSGMPVWPLYGRETGTMTGYHSAAVIAEACNKGFTGPDYAHAYELMQKMANSGYRGLPYYRAKGYIPADKEEESVSKTFEYCYDDWASAHVAKKLGKTDDAAMLSKRSGNYKNYYDASTQFMRPKLDDGKFTDPFNPIDMGHMEKWRDYTESNAWQTTFGVQHDPAGLIELFGGREPFLTKLDLLFTVPSTLPANAPPDIAGMVGQYAHGNEPSHHIAYLYVYAGAPWKTQSRVRMLLETMYSPNPDGMQGNEDVGQMSAWYLLSALGFYPVDPVSGNYILGTPLFDQATVSLGGGKQLEIIAKRTDPAHMYVQSFELNGKPQQRAWFNDGEIRGGGRIVLTMGAEPNKTLGADSASAPPSLVL